MQIRFVKAWTVRQGDGQGPRYAPGDVVDFIGPVNETYARKYIARGLAVEVDVAAERRRAAAEEKARREEKARADAAEAAAKAAATSGAATSTSSAKASA